MNALRSSARFAVHQVLASLAYGDAIGNEAIGIRAVLRDAGYTSEIFAESSDERLSGVCRHWSDLAEISHADNVLLHHFSIGSVPSRVAYALPDRMILVYHNITPAEFFVDTHPGLAAACYTGRRELGAFVDRCHLALGDSEFNRQELEAVGFRKTRVLPVVPSFAHLSERPDRSLVEEFDDGRINLLFVGRVIPSKRIEDVIKFYHALRLKYQSNARLLFVGSASGFELYQTLLYDLIASLGVPDVHFLGHVSNAMLTALYDIADLFLSASEHEGFCVPLIEAFYKRIPVVAYAAAAVPMTMDGAGVLYESKDPRHVASILNTVLTDTALGDEIVRGQDAALARLLAQDFKGKLLGAVQEVARAPRLPQLPVSEEFWPRFHEADRLDKVRQRRPGLFQALPPETDDDERV